MSTTTAFEEDATGINQSQDAQDAADLAKHGYRQQLTRALGLSGNFAIGFTYLSPLVGVYSLFTYGLATGGPSMFWSIPLVMLGQMFVMLTFAEVASQYPIAGGIFQWSKNLIGPRYAWLAGWIYTWALLITVAAVAYPIATYAGPLFGYDVTRGTTITTAVVIILLAAAVNLAGVRRLAFVAYVGVAVEVVGTIGIGLYLLAFQHTNSVSSIFHTFGAGTGGHLGAFLAACLFAVWIFYGFEACGDIAEEVKDPSRKIPEGNGLDPGRRWTRHGRAHARPDRRRTELRRRHQRQGSGCGRFGTRGRSRQRRFQVRARADRARLSPRACWPSRQRRHGWSTRSAGTA